MTEFDRLLRGGGARLQCFALCAEPLQSAGEMGPLLLRWGGGDPPTQNVSGVTAVLLV